MSGDPDIAAMRKGLRLAWGNARLSPPSQGVLDALGRVEARLAAADKTLARLRPQLQGCLEYAQGLERTTDLAIARALIGDLRDALAALEGGE